MIKENQLISETNKEYHFLAEIMTVKRANIHVLLIFPVTGRVTRREISPPDRKLLETGEGQAACMASIKRT